MLTLSGDTCVRATPLCNLILGGGGGENITAAGGNVTPTQKIMADIAVTPRTGVYAEFRGVGEAGTIMGAASIGFAK